MKTIKEKSKKIPIIDEYSVAVVGGGIAGIAAALSAKRAGAKKVVLIEREFVLGGLATAGLVTIYLPICDGRGNQVNFSIAEELFRLSIKYGAEDWYPDAWLDGNDKEARIKQRFKVIYNPNIFAICAEQLLLSEGVEIMYGTMLCGTEMNRDKIEYLYLENKSGRSAIKVGSVVDSSGDADVCKFASAKTSLYEKGNELSSWCYQYSDGEYGLKMVNHFPIPEEYKGQLTEVPIKKYRSIEAAELTEQVIDAHANLLNYFQIQLDGKISKTNAITAMPSIPEIRMTRKLNGIYDIDMSDEGKHFEDSVGVIADWRKVGPVVELPFRCLYGKEVKNLIVAGRCISSTQRMWEITRVIPACAVTGEAAGAAAAMTNDFASLDVKKLQKYLTSKGVMIRYDYTPSDLNT